MNDENELLKGYTPLILLGENDEGQIGVKIFRDVSLEEFSQLFVYLDLIEDETISYTESDD